VPKIYRHNKKPVRYVQASTDHPHPALTLSFKDSIPIYDRNCRSRKSIVLLLVRDRSITRCNV